VEEALRGRGHRRAGRSARELDPKVRDVVGLYSNPPDKAVVLSIDEKSQIQPLELQLRKVGT
jgi:hypothetical protein